MTTEPKFEYKFEHQWGGEDTWYTKSKRWANKQKFPINYLALSVIEWIYERWVKAKVDSTMADIDKQVKEVGKIWEEEDKKNQEPIVESKPSEVEGLDDISIRAPYKIDISGDRNDISLNYRKWR